MPARRTSVAPALAALDPRLRNALKAVGLAEVIIFACGFVLLSFVLDRVLELPLLIRAGLLVGAVILFAKICLRARARLRRRFSVETLAAVAERHDPALEGQLLNALELPAVLQGLSRGGGGQLEKVLSERAVTEAEMKAHAARVGIARSLDLRGVWGRAVLAALLFAAFFQMAGAAPAAFGFWFRRNVLLSDRPWPRDTHFVFDREGTEWHHARKDPLEISAWVAGEIPRDAILRISTGGEERTSRLVPGGPGKVMIPEEAALRGGIEAGVELDAKRLFHILPAVTEPVEITLEGGDNASGTIRVEVHDRPRILVARFRLVYPQYLGREPGLVENPGGDTQVPAGTRVEIEAECDQELSGGRYRFGKGEESEPERVEGKTLFASFKPDENGFLELSVTGREWGFDSRPQLRFGFIVLPDRPPAVRLAIEGDARVMTPVGKIRYTVTAEDDHGFGAVTLRRRTFSPNEARADEDVPAEETALAASPIPAGKGVSVESGGEIDLASLKLLAGSRLVLQAAASDNDALSGPKTALSAREEFLILDPEAFREEMEKVRIEAQNAIEELARREERVSELLDEWEPASGASASARSSKGSPGSAAARGATAGTGEPGEKASEDAPAEPEAGEGSDEKEAGEGAKVASGSKSAKGSKTSKGSSASKGSKGSASKAPEESGSPSESGEPSDSGSASASAESSPGSPKAASGKSASGKASSGKASSGKASSGKTASGKSASGKSGQKTASSKAAGSQAGEQGKEQPEAAGAGQPREPESSPDEPGNPENIAREQGEIAKAAKGAKDRLEGMVDALRQNQLIDPAEERRYRDEVASELERVAEEELPRSASEIRSLPTDPDPERAADEAKRRAERAADNLKKVADRLAGSGNFREVLFRLERIIELQRKVIDETEKGAGTKTDGGLEKKTPSQSREF